MPIDDLKPHVEGKTCWCHPSPCIEAPGLLIHHSMDRREEYESDYQGERRKAS